MEPNRYVIAWGADGTGYLRLPSLATAPAAPQETPAPPPDEEDTDGADERAAGRAAGHTAG